MQMLADIWLLTTEHPITMGAIYAAIATVIAAAILVARKDRP